MATKPRYTVEPITLYGIWDEENREYVGRWEDEEYAERVARLMEEGKS